MATINVRRLDEEVVRRLKHLIGPARPGQPGGHGDDVAVRAEQRLGDLDDAGVVQELHEVRVAIEGVVDRPVEEAAFRIGTAIEALRHLIAIQHPVEVDVTRPVRRR